MSARRAALACAFVALGCEGLFGVDFDDARLEPPDGAGAAGGGEGGTAGEGGTTGPGHPWTKLDLLEGDDGVPHATTDFVRAIYCDAIDRCVVATEGDDFEAGNLYAATYDVVTAIVLEGSTVASDAAFIGLEPTGSGLVARINRAEPLVLGAGDFTTPGGWSAIDPGDLGSLNGAFNTQMWFRTSAAGSVLAVSNVVLSAPRPPGASAVWERIWAPPNVPSNFFDLLVEEPLLCTVAPDIGRGPVGFVSDDLQVAAFAVGNGLNDSYPGACVSTDGASTFRYAPLPDGEVAVGGPRGMRCNDAAHCWLFGGSTSADDAYIYYSTGALDAGLTWNRASITPGPERQLRDIAFAPDNLHGFAVGVEGPSHGLVLATDDGGRTWTDNLVASESLFAGAVLLSVFALDSENIWVGGERGLLMSNGRGGQP